jgi:hypothetical protein
MGIEKSQIFEWEKTFDRIMMDTFSSSDDTNKTVTERAGQMGERFTVTVGFAWLMFH